MQKIFFFSLLFFYFNTNAQKKLDETDNEKNYLDVSAGVSNSSFSLHNNAANAQAVNNVLIFNPEIAYRLKNGISFGVTGFLANDTAKNSNALYQTALSGGYDYYGDKVLAGISYTYYFSDLTKYNSKSIFQNEALGYIKAAKGTIQPGVEVGFENGNYKEYEYVSAIVKRPLNPRGDTTVKGYDSTQNLNNYFSISPTLSHDFVFKNVLTQNDKIEFTPAFYLNFGVTNLTQTHANKFFAKRALTKLKNSTATNNFQLETIAASFESTYYLRKFFLKPDLYIDYYLPKTNAKKLGIIFSIAAGFSF